MTEIVLNKQTKATNVKNAVQSDNFKGIAIFLIVLGHNNFLTSAIPGLFVFLYSFHVTLFFVNVGLRQGKRLSAGLVRDTFVRYLVPFVCFVVALWVISTLTFFRDTPFLERVWLLVQAIVIGSAPVLDNAIGAQLYWFLPALISVVLLWYTYCSIGKTAQRIALIVFLLAHLFIGMIPKQISAWIPLGLMPAVYVFIYVPVAKRISDYVGKLGVLSIAIGGLGLSTTYFLIVKMHFYSNIGYGTMYNIFDYRYVFVQELAILSGFFLVDGLSRVNNLPKIFSNVGQVSLYIYLVHQVFFQVFWIFYKKNLNNVSLANDPIVLVVAGIPITILCILAGFFVSFLVEKIPFLKRAVFPKDYAGWTFRRN